MSENISMSDIIPASPERVYTAWLDAEQHALMTGAASSDDGGGRFTAWDGYISGRTVSAVPHEKIVQAWRTTEFPPDSPDSMLTITFTAAEGGATKVSLLQENLPEGSTDAYKKGWDEYYFAPMKKYFAAASPMEQVKEAFEETVREVKKAQKKAAATIKKVSAQVSKKVKALLKKKPAKKKKVLAKKKPAPKLAKKKSKPVAKKKKR